MTVAACPAQSSSAVRQVRFLDNDMGFAPGCPASDPHGELHELRDCNALLADRAALHERFREDGYLLIRGLQPRDQVLAAREQMLAILDQAERIDRSHPLGEGWIAAGAGGSFRGGMSDAPLFRPIVESRQIMDFFAHFLGGEPMTFDFKWTREVGTGDATGAHLDAVYMGRGTPNLFTCWTPWGDLTLDQGTLAILVGSHRLPAWEKVHQTYGKMDVDRDHVAGWFSNDPRHLTTTYGGQWATTEFRAGDVLVFGMRTIHASLTNTTRTFRLSSDTRYQLASDPIDERWVAKAGKPPIGHYAWQQGEQVPMEIKKKEWGLA